MVDECSVPLREPAELARSTGTLLGEECRALSSIESALVVATESELVGSSGVEDRDACVLSADCGRVDESWAPLRGAAELAGPDTPGDAKGDGSWSSVDEGRPTWVEAVVSTAVG